MQHAVNNVNTIIGPALIEAGIDPSNQREIDNFMLKLDGTGAWAVVISVSMYQSICRSQVQARSERDSWRIDGGMQGWSRSP